MISEYLKILILILFILTTTAYIRMDLSSYFTTILTLAEDVKQAFSSFSLANLLLSPGYQPDWGLTGQVFILGLGYYDIKTKLSYYRTIDLWKFKYVTGIDQYTLALKFGYKGVRMHIGLYDTTTNRLLYINENTCTDIRNYAGHGYKPLSVGPSIPNYFTLVQVPVILVCPTKDGKLQDITYSKLNGEKYTSRYIPALLVIQLAYA